MSEHEEKVRRLLDESHARRLTAALAAGDTARQWAELQQQLSTSEQAYAKAYRTALDSGWSEKDLRSIGLPQPPAAPRGRKAAGPASTGDPRNNGHP